MGKSQKKSTKDNSHKLERTAKNKAVRKARLARHAEALERRVAKWGNGKPGETHKTMKNRTRRAYQAETIGIMKCKTWREVQAKRAHANSFDSSVEVVKVAGSGQKTRANPLDESLSIAMAIGKVVG